MFNMLIVPGFAAAAFSNLYELLGRGLGSFSLLCRELFELDTGNFFVILVLQQAGFSFLSQLISFKDLFSNYLSPHITLQRRFILSGKEAWCKTNDTIFPYGLAFAQQLVVVSIGIVFSGTILVIPLAVTGYFLARHFADSHQLLIWHRAEIESSGAIVGSTLTTGSQRHEASDGRAVTGTGHDIFQAGLRGHSSVYAVCAAAGLFHWRLLVLPGEQAAHHARQVPRGRRGAEHQQPAQVVDQLHTPHGGQTEFQARPVGHADLYASVTQSTRGSTTTSDISREAGWRRR